MNQIATNATDVFGMNDSEKAEIKRMIMDGTKVYFDNALLRNAVCSNRKIQILRNEGRIIEEEITRHASTRNDRMIAESTRRTTAASRIHDEHVTGISGIFPDAE